jgi:hypothetical protein
VFVRECVCVHTHVFYTLTLTHTYTNRRLTAIKWIREMLTYGVIRWSRSRQVPQLALPAWSGMSKEERLWQLCCWRSQSSEASRCVFVFLDCLTLIMKALGYFETSESTNPRRNVTSQKPWRLSDTACCLWYENRHLNICRWNLAFEQLNPATSNYT